LGNLFLHLEDREAADILQPIAVLVGQRAGESMRGCVTRCLSGARSHLFVKTTEVTSLPSRLRATFGLQRRGSGHIWPVAELINTVEAFRRGAPVPRVMGFGYLQRAGLVREMFMVSEMLADHVDGLYWLQAADIDIEQFLQAAFSLFLQLHELEIFHLDLWVANIMLDPQRPTELRVVDLENCYIGSPPYFPETLGFQFGFFYFRFVKDRISEERYDQLVSAALLAYDGLDVQRFTAVYRVCKHRAINRKKRRDLLLHGILALK
jgi:hypothetical protein